MTIKTLALATALLATVTSAALAQSLVVGRSTEHSTVDPQFARTGNNHSTARDIFDRLVEFDPKLQMRPGLAVSWRTSDPLTWEIALRPGVTFHDGGDFTAEDVIFSMERVKTIKNSPAPFTGYLQTIESMEAVGPHMLRIETTSPTPQLIEDIGQIYIVSKAVAEGKSQADFNSGAAAIGTGPYKFVRWSPNDRLELQRNEDYWGERPDHQDVTVRFLANDAARVAAFLSGEVQVIDLVPPADIARLEAMADVQVFSIDSGRVIYLGLNQRAGPLPALTDTAGAPLQANPFQKADVRRAISKMIDRQLIIDRLLRGQGTAAGQLVPAGIGGYAPDLAPDTPDPAAAKELLAQAGHPEGFGVTIHSSNDRFAADDQIAQVLGQMLARGGLKVNGVETQPYSVYAGNATKGAFGAFVFSLGTTRSNASGNLMSLLQTYDEAKGSGNFNRMRYANPAFDAKLAEALAEFDEGKRNALLQKATRIVMSDVAIVPLYWPRVSWATRGGLTVVANMGEDTGVRDVGRNE